MGVESKGWAIAFCGLNCARCDMYEAAHGNTKLRDEIVKWFKEQRNEIIKPEQIKCEGCRGPLDVQWSSDCKIMLCAKKKEVRYCFQCTNFPCNILNTFASDDVSHHKRTVGNLKNMRRIGIGAWIAQQDRNGKRVFCP